MNQITYDQKTILIDFNFLDLEQYSVDDLLFFRKLLFELNAHQNLLLLTNNPDFIAQEKLKELEIKNGFLIANNGAVIINIATQTEMYSSALDAETINRICLQCIWNNLCFSINTKETKYLYGINSWLIQKHKAGLSYLNKYLSNTIETSKDLQKLIPEIKIFSIEIFFLERISSVKQQQIQKFLQKIKDLSFNYTTDSTSLHITHPEASIINAVNYLEQKMEWDLKNDGLYCGISQIHMEIAKKTYLSAITNEIKELTNYSKAEVIDWGTSSWINWFWLNIHLWHGENTKTLIQSLKKNLVSSINPKEINHFKNGDIRHLHISSNKQMSFWKEQIPEIINFIEDSKLI